MLADSWRGAPDLQSLAIYHCKATGIFQSLARPRIHDILPKVSRLELRVKSDVCDGRHRIAEHLALDCAFEKFVLANGGKKTHDGSFEPIHFVLRDVRYRT